MKKTKICFSVILSFFIAMSPKIFADTMHPKQELRSVWMSSLGIDWPLEEQGSTEACAEIQKAEAVKYIEVLKSYGFNCVFLHVRPMADRVYLVNTYDGVTIQEPFSHYVSGTRGKEPSYDPLQFWIDECHKCGMELHVWLNPYRFCNYTSSSIPDKTFNPRGNGTQFDSDVFNSGEIISHSARETSENKYTTYYIFNPALESTTRRISDVCKVLTGAYDIDGIVFDDYFYPNGISSSASAADYPDYEAYKGSGGTLSIGNWRRKNINDMIAKVNETIKSIKPWVRFGISPAGAAGAGLKSSDGLPALSQFCSASDWQYSGIFSDPMAWLRDKSIDYISPQLYWKTTHSTNPFGPMARWWSIVANKFGRHFYASNSISFLSPTKDSNGNIIQVNNIYENWMEVSGQLTLNRQAIDENGGEGGIVVFSAKNIDGSALSGVGEVIKAENFQYPALVPAMTWLPGYNPGNIKEFTKDGAVLNWKGYDNVRYTVYAVPTSVPVENFSKDVEYLVDMTYATTFTLPSDRLSGYNYAVCVLDRYGNEYSPMFLGASARTLPAPTLSYPVNEECIEAPFASFQWESVDGATSYIIEIATDEAMTQLVRTWAVNTNACPTSDLDELPYDTPLYWRVRACGTNYNDGISATKKFSVRELLITAPDDDATGISLTPTINWTMPEREVELQISSTGDFSAKDLILSLNTKGGSYTVPRYMLSAYTTYSVRLLFEHDGETYSSSVRSFTTLEMEPEVPSIAQPVDGGDLHSNRSIQITPVEGARSYRLEVSESSSFPARTSYISTNISPSTWTDSKTGAEIRLNNKALVDGSLYYARVRASYISLTGTNNTDYSEPTAFYYRSEAGVESVAGDAGVSVLSADYSDPSSPVITVNFEGLATIKVTDMAGREVATLYSGELSGNTCFKVKDLPSGVYLVTIGGSSVHGTLKISIR